MEEGGFGQHCLQVGPPADATTGLMGKVCGQGRGWRTDLGPGPNFGSGRGIFSKPLALQLPESLLDWHLQKTRKSPAASKATAATSSRSTPARAECQLRLRAPHSHPLSASSPGTGCPTLGVPTAAPHNAVHVTQLDPCMPTALPGAFSSKQGFDRERKPSSTASL